MILKILKESISFILNPRFDSHIWKTRPNLRKYYVTDLMRGSKLLGKNRSEIEFLLGSSESNTLPSEYCTYNLGYMKKKKIYLVLEFSDDKVKTVRYIYKNIYRMGYY